MNAQPTNRGVGPGGVSPMPSAEEVEAARHTREQLAAWGVEWPPPKGWKEALARRRADLDAGATLRVPTVTVYSDGSGTTGGPAGIAYVLMEEGAIIDEGSLPLPDATNQQAEIRAAAYALHSLPEGQDVLVVSDSKHVVNGWNEWLPMWRARGWRKRRGGTPSNLDLWRRLSEAAERHASVRCEWCRGHDGNVGNERADVLAGEARQAAIRGDFPDPDTYADRFP